MKNPNRTRGLWISLAVIAILAIASIVVILLMKTITPADQGLTNPPLNTSSQVAEVGSATMETNGQSQLRINLIEGQAQPQAAVPLPVATGEPLTPERISEILARLPILEPGTQDRQEFLMPEESLPPPRTGQTIQEPFPPVQQPGEAEPVPSGPLEILRYAPEGSIPIAPFVNITFNQPMVPLATLEDLAAIEVPATIEPALPGTWRWLGTRTLTFEYDSELIDRLPMATQYLVTVPAGTRSQTGGELANTTQFSFSTPPPQVTGTYPYDTPQPLEPLFFVSFDQRINEAAVLDTIQVTAGGQAVSLRLASEAELEADKTASRLAKNSGEGRWLVFRATQPLPPDSGIQVSIGPGTPSAEGPLVTEQAQTYSFHTFAPLRIEEHGCTWHERCPPLTPFYIRFNNPLDPEAYDPEMLSIKPELPGASVDIIGNTLQIQGVSQGQTTYQITVSGEIRDIFGQTLGEDATLSFRVGPAEPVLIGPENTFITLDPASQRPVVSLYTINYNRLDVQIYAVTPSDWPAFQTYLREYQRTDKPPAPPGRRVRSETQPVEAPADTLTEVEINLSSLMDGATGHFIVIVKPPTGLFQQDRYWETVQVWVQVTQIGIDALVDHSEMLVWTTSLMDGSPLSGVTIQAGNTQAISGEDGLARFSIPADGAPYLVASLGSDEALLPAHSYYWDDTGWQPRSTLDELRWYVFDDRQMYRPNEEVHVKGWLRRVGARQTGDVGLAGQAISALRYHIVDPQGNDIGDGRTEVNSLGGFDLAFTLPENANLGYAQLILEAEGQLSGLTNNQYYHSFQIQEFRRPEFEVQARNETTGPYFTGGQAVVAVEAKYYAGGPLPNAEVTWLVSSTPTNYQPPNWPDFTFGYWEPWFWAFRGGPEGDFYFESSGESQTFSGMTDVTGNHYLQLDFEAPAESRPFSVLAEATVMDVNRQAWSGTTNLLVHPAELYVGLRSEKYFVARGTPLDIELIVTDLDGNVVVDRPVKVTAARLDWKYRAGQWQEIEVDLQDCTIGSAQEPVVCSFDTPAGGRYQITALVTDEFGRQNQSRFFRWVSGGQLPPDREVKLESVTLIPDQESYQPGDVAQILVQSPFSPAEGLLTVSRSGLLYSERFVVEDGSATLSIPIETAHIPNLQIQVDLVGAAPRTDDAGETISDAPLRPAYASGQIDLDIPPLERRLTMQVTPADTEMEPGAETSITALLTDSHGQPVPNAELAVVVVDEAILALTNYQLADPLVVFYQHRPADVSSYYGRASIVLVNPLTLTTAAAEVQAVTDRALMKEGEVMLEAAPMEMPAAAEPAMEEAMGGGSAPEPIRVRLDFNPLATFAPIVRTGADGSAKVGFKLPDNLTRYRVMVVAVDESGRQFGAGEANLTARLPLMVRPSAPRFLNFGDRFELPVVLQNQTNEPLSVEVALQTSNLTITDHAGIRVEVPANDRVEVRFPAAAEMAGTARFQIAAVSGSFADAAQGELPVFTPATTEAFATYGVVDSGAVVQPVASPSNVFPQFGGLEIQTSSTALQALTDAVLYLVSYPFECSEQLASRILGIAALRDVLTAFSAEGLPAPQEMEASVTRDIERLRGLQNWDGGFPYWRRGQESIPFNTIHVAHALQRARLKGFEVPEEMLASALNYLQDIESHYPSWYNRRIRQILSAYALHVRNLIGDRDPDKARSLINEAGLENLSLEAVGWLWGVLLDDPNSTAELESIRRLVNNRVVETAGAANFTTDYDDQTYLLLSSNRRTDAILLETLIADNPQSDLIPKLVNGLLAHRTRGRWYNTQENVFVLLALDRYFNTFEAQTPDFVARFWLGETYAGSHTFTGRTTERYLTQIPMEYLVDPALGGGETQDLVLSKEGSGRLYYRLGLRYAPTDLELEPLDMGFVVQRTYEAVDDPADVSLDENGTWHIRAGARVRVRLSMVADNRRYHVALVDPLPAGLEIVNPALAVSGSVPQDPDSSDYRYGWWWWGTWYEHQNLRDERAEAFTSLLWDGVYDYTYIARATTPGTFVVPPAKAEEMYSPEVFGRSSSDLVVVE